MAKINNNAAAILEVTSWAASVTLSVAALKQTAGTYSPVSLQYALRAAGDRHAYFTPSWHGSIESIVHKAKLTVSSERIVNSIL